MAVIARPRRIERNPVRAARERRQRFPWYFEMDSAVLFMAGVALLCLTCLLYLLQTSRVAVLGYEIQSVQSQQAEARRQMENLKYEIDRRQSLPAVEQYARTKLHMRPITNDYEYVPMELTKQEIQQLDETPSDRATAQGKES